MGKNRVIIIVTAIISVLIAGVILFLIGGGNDLDYARLNVARPFDSRTNEASGEKTTSQDNDVHAPIIKQWEASSHAKAAESLAKTGGADDVCYSCHSADYFYKEVHQQPAPVTKNGITCIVCHKLTSSSLVLVIGDRIQLCTRCHTAGRIEPGKEVRHSQAQIYLGTGAIDLPAIPNPKAEKGVACSDCHMPNKSHEFRALTPREAEKENRTAVCTMCHQDKKREDFAAEVDTLQKVTAERTGKLLGDLKYVRKRLQTAKEKGLNVKHIEKEYGVIYTNVTIVDADKSKGVHNPEYVNLILEDAEKRTETLRKSLP